MAKDKNLNSKNCIFCQIVSGKLPTSLRYEDEDIIAFDDINPNAPIHVLVIPKIHIESLADTNLNHQKLLGKLLYRCKLLAKDLNIVDNGYRVIINTGKWGGQVIPHLHVHLLGGAPLTSELSIGTAEKNISMVKTK